MAPRFKAGDFGGGIERGVDDIITVLTTDSSEWEKHPQLRIVRQDAALDALGPWTFRVHLLSADAAQPTRQSSFVPARHADEFRPGRRISRRLRRRMVRWRLFRRRRIVGRRRRLGELVMAHLSAEDRRRVGDAIKAAEATTAGEIVCVLARASSDYMSSATAWSALIALIAPWFLIALTNFSVHEFFLAQVVIFVVLFLILSESPLSRVLVPRRARRAEAHRVAMEQFMIRGQAEPRGCPDLRLARRTLRTHRRRRGGF
jgi:hypothetical protein